MTTYYVATTGSDSNNGLSAATPFKTLGKVVTVEAAGDVVYVAPGWYRESVALTTSGTNGSLITWIGDVQGTMTLSQPGRIFITNRVKTGTLWEIGLISPLTITDQKFRRFEYMNFLGGYVSGVLASGSVAASYEQVQFYGCHLATQTMGDNSAYAFFVAFNEGISPTTTGLLFDNCTFNGYWGGTYKSQVTSDIDLKVKFTRCAFIGTTSGVSSLYFSRSGSATSPNYTAGGFTIQNCLFLGGNYCIDFNPANWTATTPGLLAQNNVFLGSNGTVYLYGSSAAAANFIGRNNQLVNVNETTNYATVTNTIHQTEFYLEGLHDPPVVSKMLADVGMRVVPYAQAMPPDELAPISVGYSPTGLIENKDAYGENHPYKVRLLRANVAGSHSGTGWASGSYESNIIDGSYATYSSSTTTGSESSHWVQTDGTESFGSFDPGTITAVYLRTWHRSRTSIYTLGFKVYTSDLGETLASSTLTIPLHASNIDNRYCNETLLTAPSGGWTAAKVTGLKARFWRTAGTASLNAVDFVVVCANGGNMIGPVSPVTQTKAVAPQRAMTVTKAIIGPGNMGAAYQDGALDTITLNDNNNQVCTRFIINSTDQITHVGFHVTTAVGAVSYYVGLVVMNTSGVPTATPYGGSEIATYSSTNGDIGWKWVELPTPATPVIGDLCAVFVWPTASVPDGSNYMTVVSQGYTPGSGWYHEAIGSYVAGRSSFAYRCANGTIVGNAIIERNFVKELRNNYDPDEAGNVFVLSAQTVVSGARFPVHSWGTTADYIVRIFDSNNNIIASSPTLTRYFSPSAGIVEVLFAPTTLNANVPYYVSVLAKSTGSLNSVYLQKYQFESMEAKAAWGFGLECSAIERIDNGQWRVLPTVLYNVSLIVDSVSYSEVTLASIFEGFPLNANIIGSGRGEISVDEQGREIIVFDKADESCDWSFIAPARAIGTNLKLYISYAMQSATSGNVKFDASVEVIVQGGSFDLSAGTNFDTANTVTVAVPTSANRMTTAEISLDNRASMAEGNWVRLRLRRNGAAGADTATGYCRVYGVEMRNV